MRWHCLQTELAVIHSDQHQHCQQQLAAVFLAMNKSLSIIAPVFVPGNNGLKLLEAMIAKGITVNVYTNSLEAQANLSEHSAYQAYRPRLVAMGVNLFERKIDSIADSNEMAMIKSTVEKQLTDRNSKKSKNNKKIILPSITQLPSQTHVFIIDEQYIFIGNLQLSKGKELASININTDKGMLLESEAIVAKLQTAISDIELNSYQLLLQSDFSAEKKSAKSSKIKRKQALVWQHQVDGQQQVLSKEPSEDYWRFMGSQLMSVVPAASNL